MQYDMARFDQPLVDETQPKAHVWTDIGEVEVEHSIFGNAKVRVYRKRDDVRGALGWTLVAVGLVVGAVWLVKDASRQPEIVYVAPQPQKMQSAVPRIKPRATPAVASPTPLPPLQAQSAPDAAKPAPVTVKSATFAAPVAGMEKPVVPAAPLASQPVVTQTPAVAASAPVATH